MSSGATTSAGRAKKDGGSAEKVLVAIGVAWVGSCVGVVGVRPDQHLAFLPADAIPGQAPDFGIPQPCAEPQQKQRVIPGLVALQVAQHGLDFFHTQYIALH